jgi:DtxR family Mn-dependent transcriptional regulator
MGWLVLLIGMAVFFWPEYGLYIRWRRGRRLKSRQTLEDALLHLHHRQHEQRLSSLESLAGALKLSTRDALALVNRMSQQNLVAMTGDGLQLTEEGRRWALQVIRAHRLFERYLADETGVPMEEIHGRADRLEHTVTVEETNKMDADMGHPAFDPQGDPIPNASGEIPVFESHALLDWPVDVPAQIVHIEDEPPEVYAQIVAEGLRVGSVVTVVFSSPVRLELETEAGEHLIAPVIAANIAVRKVSSEQSAMQGARLTTLYSGQKARVTALDPQCQGLTRRRFLDLGITPGTLIEPVMQSAFGEPVAYRVRNSLIALRREQSDMIWIEPLNTE